LSDTSRPGKTRAEAAAAKLQTHQGHDPAAARAEDRRLAAAGIDKAALFETIWGEYVADEKPRVGTWRESTAKAANHVFEKLLRPKWGKRRLDEITKTDVRLLLKGIHLRHPSAARRTRAVVAAFFNWAVADDRLDSAMLAIARAEARKHGEDPNAVYIDPWRFHATSARRKKRHSLNGALKSRASSQLNRLSK
jgi:hypothetical protein